MLHITRQLEISSFFMFWMDFKEEKSILSENFKINDDITDLFDILENSDVKYDQIAMVDLDTMIKWNTPNFFELTNNELSAIKDNEVVEWTYNSKNGYQHMFPDVEFDWWDYVNAGFVVVNKKHRDLFKSMIDFYHKHKKHLLDLQYNELKKGSDQTPFNYMIRKMNYNINYLPKIYNMTSIHRKGRRNI